MEELHVMKLPVASLFNKFFLIEILCLVLTIADYNETPCLNAQWLGNFTPGIKSKFKDFDGQI